MVLPLILSVLLVQSCCTALPISASKFQATLRALQAAAQTQKACVELPPLPTFSATKCAEWQEGMAKYHASEWDYDGRMGPDTFHLTGGLSNWTMIYPRAHSNQELVPAHCQWDRGAILHFVSIFWEDRWQIVDHAVGLSGTFGCLNCLCVPGSTCPTAIDFTPFPSTCVPQGLDGGPGIFFVSKNGNGICCETDSQRYCMSLDTVEPSCDNCTGLAPAEATLGDNGLQAIKGTEKLAQQAYYDIWGVLTIGYGFTDSSNCLATKLQYSRTMNAQEALSTLGKCVSQYTQQVKKWLTTSDVNCIPQNVFDALVPIMYNCWVGCFTQQMAAAIKDSKWNALAAQIQATKASVATKAVAVALIQNTFVPPEDVQVPAGTRRCQPYFNKQCGPACGKGAWTSAMASDNPTSIVLTIPPGATAAQKAAIAQRQRTCNRCVKALLKVKGVDGCNRDDKFGVGSCC